MVSHEDRKESRGLMVSHEDRKESGGLMVSHEDYKESGGLMVSHEDCKESEEVSWWGMRTIRTVEVSWWAMRTVRKVEVSWWAMRTVRKVEVSCWVMRIVRTKSSQAIRTKSLGATLQSVVKNEFHETIIDKILKTLFTVTMTVDRELVNQVSSQEREVGHQWTRLNTKSFLARTFLDKHFYTTFCIQ